MKAMVTYVKEVTEEIEIPDKFRDYLDEDNTLTEEEYEELEEEFNEFVDGLYAEFDAETYSGITVEPVE